MTPHGVKAAGTFSFIPANTALRCHSNKADRSWSGGTRNSIAPWSWPPPASPTQDLRLRRHRRDGRPPQLTSAIFGASQACCSSSAHS
jgi:hypothetical protein